MSRRWTPDELKLLTRYRKYLYWGNALFRRFDRTPEAIKLKLKRMDENQFPKSRRFWTNTELKFLDKNTDKPLEWLAAELNRSVGSVQTQISRRYRAMANGSPQ